VTSRLRGRFGAEEVEEALQRVGEAASILETGYEADRATTEC